MASFVGASHFLVQNQGLPYFVHKNARVYSSPKVTTKATTRRLKLSSRQYLPGMKPVNTGQRFLLWLENVVVYSKDSSFTPPTVSYSYLSSHSGLLVFNAQRPLSTVAVVVAANSAGYRAVCTVVDCGYTQCLHAFSWTHTDPLCSFAAICVTYIFCYLRTVPTVIIIARVAIFCSPCNCSS